MIPNCVTNLNHSHRILLVCINAINHYPALASDLNPLSVSTQDSVYPKRG